MKSFPAACGGARGLGVEKSHWKKWGSVESQLLWHLIFVGEAKTEAPGGDSCCQDNSSPGGGHFAFTAAWRCLFPYVELSIHQALLWMRVWSFYPECSFLSGNSEKGTESLTSHCPPRVDLWAAGHPPLESLSLAHSTLSDPWDSPTWTPVLPDHCFHCWVDSIHACSRLLI